MILKGLKKSHIFTLSEFDIALSISKKFSLD